MDKTIYKYEITPQDACTVSMPLGAEILDVQVQKESPCIWALVNPKERLKVSRVFETYGTGHPINHDMGVDRKYIGTFQLHDGALVFHLFERF